MRSGNRLVLLATLTPALLAAAPVAPVASMDEAHFATQVAQQVGMFRYCGMQAALGAIPAQSDAFIASHHSMGRPMQSDMPLAVGMSIQSLMGKAGGKPRFCAALAQYRQRAVSGTEATWAKLQEAHGKAKTAGH